MLIAYAKAGNPPFVQVRVIPITYMDAAPATHRALVGVIEILKTIEVVEIPSNGSVFAVNLESVECLVASSVSSRLEESQRPVGKVAVKKAGVVNGDCLLLPGSGVNAFLDEGFGHCRDITDASI